MFQVGEHRLAIDVGQVTEVVPRVRLTPAPGGSAAGLAGTFVYRGRVVPVVDLHAFLDAGECPPHLSSRIILAPDPRSSSGELLGLLAAKVADVRELSLQKSDAPAASHSSLGKVIVDGTDLVHLVELERLLERRV